MTKLKCTTISDTHEKHEDLELKGGDILIHCGDATQLGTPRKVHNFLKWFGAQNYKYKVMIAGNHDIGWEPMGEGLHKKTFHFRGMWLVKKGLEKTYRRWAEANGIIYLHNKLVEIEGCRIYGSPYQKMIDKWNVWAFNYYCEEGYSWDHIPEDIDILVTHCPPYGILDNSKSHYRYGSPKLAARVEEVKPQVHCFGHIHEGYGRLKKNGVIYINAAMADENYEMTRKPKNFTVKVGE